MQISIYHVKEYSEFKNLIFEGQIKEISTTDYTVWNSNIRGLACQFQNSRLYLSVVIILDMLVLRCYIATSDVWQSKEAFILIVPILVLVLMLIRFFRMVPHEA